MGAPRIPEDFVVTGDVVYVRLHGRSRWYRHDYTDEELSEYAVKIRDSGAREAWVYFDNDNSAFAIKNAHELIRQLRAMGVTIV